MERSFTAWAALAACIALASCGGGGGGTAPPAAGADEPTLVLSRPGSTSGYSTVSLATATMSAAAYVHNLGQLAVDATHRLAAPGSPSRLDAECPIRGSLSLTLDDRDRDGRASAGDAVTAVFDHCGMPLLQRVLSGTLVIELKPAALPGLDAALQAQLQLGAGLQLDTNGFHAPLEWNPNTIKGSLTVAWSRSDTRTRVELSSTSLDDLRFEGNANAGWGLVALRRIALVKEVRFDDARIDQTIGFVLEWPLNAGARAVVSTPVPMVFDLNRGPRSGAVVALAANGQSVRITGPDSPYVSAWNAEYLSATGTRLDLSLASTDGHQGTLSWDGRRTVALNYGSAVGSTGTYVELPTGPGRAYDLMDLFMRRGDFDVRTDTIDEIFVHPVQPEPASTRAVVRIQRNSAPSPAASSLQWRFHAWGAEDTPDPAGSIVPVVPAWNVPAQATQTGALVRVQALEPLLYGQTYQLQASNDGVDWSRTIELQQADGETLLLSPEGIVVQLPGTLMLGIDAAESVIPAADRPAHLSASATTTDAAGVASWHWQQLDGAPLIIDTPDAAQTTVRYAAGALRPIGLATLQLTVVDTRGRSTRSRVVLRAGDSAPSGALHYRVTRLSTLPQDFTGMTFGVGSVVPAAGDSYPAGSFNLRVQGPLQAGWGLVLRMPDGAALVAGDFPGALPPPVAGGTAMLACDTLLCPGGSGHFTVLEVEVATDGSVRRLAVDYEQTIPDTTIQTTVRGSYRFNSNIPIRP